MPSPLLLDFLDRSHADYQLIRHRPAASAGEAAHLLGVSPRRFGKAVMLRVGSELVIMVIPANCRVNPLRLSAQLAGASVEVAAPRQFLHRFPRCEPGAMPPFGHLFGLRTLGSALPDELEILFKAGSHGESMVMPVAEFRRLSHVEDLPGCAETAARSLLSRRAARRAVFATHGHRQMPHPAPQSLDPRWRFWEAG